MICIVKIDLLLGDFEGGRLFFLVLLFDAGNVQNAEGPSPALDIHQVLLVVDVDRVHLALPDVVDTFNYSYNRKKRKSPLRAKNYFEVL